VNDPAHRDAADGVEHRVEQSVEHGVERQSIRVSVNLLWCVPGAVGGSEQYLARQLLGLREVRPLDDLTLHCLPGFAAAHPELASRATIDEAPITGENRSRRILAEHTWLPRRTRSADLVHHGGGTVPLASSDPMVLTVHDLQYLALPSYFGTSRRAYLSAMMPRSVRRADVVAVPTEYVRGTVVEAFDVDPARVVVVPHGVEPHLGQGAASAEELRARYGLGDGPILVFPAITHPHKGHRFLLEVMAACWPDPDLRLVLIGGRGAADAQVEDSIDELGLRDRVVRPGRVSDEDRDGLISLADALVFPSEYEGFGAPVVEAMALGTPVVSSDQAALAEVVGGAGLVLPRSREAWAEAIDTVLRRRESLVAAGLDRARSFTTAASGSALAEAYVRALEAA
jgi:alpha-1,3-rhamnosyl/mannosyltransferase